MGRNTLTNPVKVIRKHCLECLGGSSQAIAECTNEPCDLYPFRFGTNPYRTKKTMTEEQRKAAGERLKKAREAKND